MFKSTFLTVLVVSIFLVMVGMLLPGKQKDIKPLLPWSITATEDGSISVFGLTLGKSTLRDMENLIQEQPEVSLFLKNDKTKKVEAYFDQSRISGFRAKIAVEMAVSDEVIDAYFKRGIRIAKAGGDKHKVTLTDADMAQLYDTPIATITYLPKANLTDEMVQKRFGEPAEKITEREGVVHWLYPEKGLDVLVSADEKEVIQYIPPRDFDRLLKPLREGKQIAPDLK